MSLIQNLRNRRQANRDNRAITRAMRSAPTPSMRDEIALLAQRRIS